MVLCIKVVHWPQILDLNRNADALILKNFKEIGIIKRGKKYDYCTILVVTQ